MKKSAVVMAALVLVAQLCTVAQAETCYKLTPFVDILRLSVHVDEGSANQQHVFAFGEWTAGSSYTLPVVGAREFAVGGSSKRLGIHGTNVDASAFGGNPICSLDGVAGHPWSLTCVGGSGATFRNSGSSLTQISCSSLPPASVGMEAGK